MTQETIATSQQTLDSHGAKAAEFSPATGLGKVKPVPALRTLAIGAGLAAVVLGGGALAQPSLGGDTVSWSASAPAQGLRPGGRVKITLRGAVQTGWHVYGLQQLPDGPTPLRVALDAAGLAVADGQPTGTAPIKLQDPSFNLETQYYEHDFTVTAPVRIGTHAAAGQQQIPISVRFQTCNGHICQPPKTVKLSVPVTVRANG